MTRALILAAKITASFLAAVLTFGAWLHSLDIRKRAAEFDDVFADCGYGDEL